MVRTKETFIHLVLLYLYMIVGIFLQLCLCFMVHF